MEIFLDVIIIGLLAPFVVGIGCGCVYIIKRTIDFLRGAKMCWRCDDYYHPNEKNNHGPGICKLVGYV